MRDGFTQKRVHELRPGDVLAGTNLRVVHVTQPLRGGHDCIVDTLTPKGRPRTHTWRARTTVTILSPTGRAAMADAESGQRGSEHPAAASAEAPNDGAAGGVLTPPPPAALPVQALSWRAPSSTSGPYPAPVRDQVRALDEWDGTDDHADPQEAIYEPLTLEDYC